MTTYKKPVFFDRDIAAFSELSEDAGLDLGLVARSILADAALQVGTTGSAGTVSVKNASNAATISLQGADGTATFSNMGAQVVIDASNGQIRAQDSLVAGTGGWIGSVAVKDNAGSTRVDASGYGRLDIKDSNGADLRVRLSDEDWEGGGLSAYDDANLERFRVRASGPSQGLSLFDANGFARFKATENAVTLRDENNTARVQLGGGGLIAVFDSDGNQKIGISAEVGNPGTVWTPRVTGLDTAQITFPDSAVNKEYLETALQALVADAETLPAATGLVAGQACVINSSGEAATAGTTSSGAWAIGVVTAINGDPAVATIVRGGVAANVLTGATPGDQYYVQADGTLGTDLPVSGRIVLMGFAKSATDLHVQIRDFGTVV